MLFVTKASNSDTWEDCNEKIIVSQASSKEDLHLVNKINVEHTALICVIVEQKFVEVIDIGIFQMRPGLK